MRRTFLHPFIALVSLLFAASLVWALTPDMTLVGTLHEPRGEHIEQSELVDLVTNGDPGEAFNEAFEHGDELFETEFNALDGIGANVGDGSRFTRIPRADLTGAGQWGAHTPSRATGPNAMSCNACHEQLFDDGAGSPVGNVHRDPLHSGNIRQFIQRNTPHVFALGALQRLAEEMTADMLRTRDLATTQACSFGASTLPLATKGVSFGSIRAVRTQSSPCRVTYDTSRVVGVATDLIVRPFQWKGSMATVRDFNRDAANNELGMQAVEFTGDNLDGDGDGVVNELTVGDITALSIYLAAQPRPTTSLELSQLGLIDRLGDTEVKSIVAGAVVFRAIGCANCHMPRMLLDDPIFSEPSQMKQYRDARFPAGQDPLARGVDPARAIKFDLTRDQPDNVVENDDGTVYRLGSFVKDSRGKAIIELYSDLKRHNMGPRLAESIDEVGTGNATFLTRTLWGIASTAPYMHDGRATTLTEAILEHGGEAAASRANFLNVGAAAKEALCTFLDNLVLFKMEEEEVVVPPPPTLTLAPQLQIKKPSVR
jgi:cytochrome c peroxidase